MPEGEIIRELIETYEELIEHLGDDMIDSRRNRINELAALGSVQDKEPS